MKKLLLFLILVFPFSHCTDCSFTDLKRNAKPYYDLQSITALPLQVIGIDSSTGSPFLKLGAFAEAKPLVPDSLVIAITGDVTYYASHSPSRSVSPWAAYACDPVPPGDKGTKEEVQAITVRCDQDFDATHPAGSSLNAYFDYLNGSYLTRNRVGNLAEYSNQFPVPAERYFGLRLLQAPDRKTGTYTFTVEYALTNGEVLTARTRNITFK
jgi:hypothetical protein